MTLTFRPARPRDLDRILEVYTVAYPDDRNGETRRQQLTTHRFGPLARLLLAEEDGELAAFGFGFDVRFGFGGRLVRAVAVASVAVAAHARGRGVGTALVRRLEERGRDEGAALSVLYPFRQGFYARLGYAPTSPRKRLDLAPEAIPRAFADVPGVAVGPLREGDAAALRSVHARALRRESGLVERSDALWERRLVRERSHWLVARRGARTVGYVAFAMQQPEPHGETSLVVEELVADTAPARRALLGALSRMRDQVARVILEVAADDPLEHALLDADGRRHGTADVEHTFGTLVGGPMIALLDLPRAVEARGYAKDGRFELEVDGEPLVMRVERGRARVAGGRVRDPFRTTSQALARVLYGALVPASAVALGLADASGAAASRLADTVRMPGVLALDPF